MLPSAEMLSLTVIPSAEYKVAYLIKKKIIGHFYCANVVMSC